MRVFGETVERVCHALQEEGFRGVPASVPVRSGH